VPPRQIGKKEHDEESDEENDESDEDDFIVEDEEKLEDDDADYEDKSEDVSDDTEDEDIGEEEEELDGVDVEDDEVELEDGKEVEVEDDKEMEVKDDKEMEVDESEEAEYTEEESDGDKDADESNREEEDESEVSITGPQNDIIRAGPKFAPNKLRQHSLLNIQKMVAIHNLAWPTNQIALVSVKGFKESKSLKKQTGVTKGKARQKSISESESDDALRPPSPPASEAIETRSLRNREVVLELVQRTPSLSKTPSRTLQPRSSVKRKYIIDSDDENDSYNPSTADASPLSKKNRTQ